MNLSPGDQILQLVIWSAALIEFVLALYILVLNSRHPANRHVSVLLLLFAANSLGHGLMIEARDASQAMLPTWITAAVGPAATPGLLLLSAVLLKPQWLRGRWRRVWWVVYGLIGLPILLTLLDVGLGTRLWYTGLDAATYTGGYVSLFEYAAGSLSLPLRVTSFYAASLVTLIPLLYIALRDREVTPLNRRLAWLLLGAQLVGIIAQMGLRLWVGVSVSTVITNSGFAIAWTYAAFQQMVSERRFQTGSRLQVRLTALILVVTIPVLVAAVVFVRARALALIEQVAVQQQAIDLPSARLQFRQGTWPALAIGSAMLLALAWLTVRQALRPIGTLTDTAAAIATGDLTRVAPVESEDEIGILARAFNNMTERLRELVGSLEQRVAERTSELQERTAEVEATAVALAARGEDLENALAELRNRETELEEAVRLQEEARLRQEEINRELQEANEATRRRSTQLQATADVSRAIAQVRDPDELFPQVAQLISQHFGFYHVGIFLVSEGSRDAVLRATNSEGGRRLLAQGYRLSVGGQGVIGYVTATGHSRVALDVGTDAIFLDNPDLPATRSEMALPLRLGDRIIGALDVQSTEPNAFDEQDAAVLQTLADQVTIALENARLLSETQVALTKVEAAQRRYLGEEWRRYAQRATTLSHEYLLGGREALADQPLPAGEAALIKGDTITLSEDDDYQGAALAVPIKLRDQVIGVIDLQEMDENRVWSDEEIALTKAIAEQLGLAIEGARLFEQTQSRARRETLTRQITERIRDATDVDAMLQTAIRELGRALNAPKVYVRLATDLASNDGQHDMPPEATASAEPDQLQIKHDVL
jgi:GAF domain-containing protein/HAMP domain-containing protein